MVRHRKKPSYRKLLFVLFSVSMQQHPTGAFQCHPQSITSLSRLKMSTEEETDEYTAGSTLSNGTESIFQKMSGILKVPPGIELRKPGFLSPRPPEYSPRVDEQLQVDLMESDRMVQLLKAEIQMVREMLDMAGDELLEEQNRFRDERRSLKDQIDISSVKLFKLDEERRQERIELSQQQSKERTNLLNDAKLLSDQLEQKTRELSSEQETNRILKEQLDEAQDTLQKREREYASHQKELKAYIDEEQKKVIDIEETLRVKEASFHILQEDWMKQVKVANDKVLQAEETRVEMKTKLSSAEAKLKTSLQSTKDVKGETERFEKELEALRQSLTQEQASSKNLNTVLEQERQTFNVEKEKLQTELKDGRTVIIALEKKMKDAEITFQNDIAALETKLKDEAERITLARKEEAKLKEHEFAKEKVLLKERYASALQLYEQTKEKLRAQSDEVRSQLDEQLEKAQSKNQAEKASLEKMHKNKLNENESKAALLNEELCKLKLKNEELMASICHVRSEKEESEKQAKEMKATYKKKLAKAEEASIDEQEKVFASKNAELLEENKSLQLQVAETMQLYKEAKVTMKDRTEEVRREITEKLEVANSVARLQEATTKELYEKKLAAEEAQVSDLKDDLHTVKAENKELTASLSRALKQTKESEAKSERLKEDCEKFEESISLLDKEFRDVTASKEELEFKLNEVAEENEKSALKIQELEANYELLWNQNKAQNEAAYMRTRDQASSQRTKGSNNFHWAMDQHTSKSITSLAPDNPEQW